MRVVDYLKKREYEKKKKYWRNVIYDGGIRYRWCDGIWKPIPSEAYTYFTNDELVEIFEQRKRDELELRKLLEQLE